MAPLNFRKIGKSPIIVITTAISWKELAISKGCQNGGKASHNLSTPETEWFP